MTETTEDKSQTEIETPQSEAVDTAAMSDPEAVQAELAAEVAALKDRLLRTMAEMENLRKRAERDKQDAGKYAVSSFARDLLNVSDNLQRALQSLPEDEIGEGSVKVFVDGVDMTERELLRAFEKVGIRKIEPMGEKFDHNFHEAMFEVPMADQAPGTIIQVVQPGYVIHDRLLRAARVGVSRAADANNGNGEPRVDTRA
ncbi:nucleotide exchange factor GrpE [Govanella unica]|uniref:Protein GrpE n=1 Tax=Govanella unica TaxID=2975056 RepID=A0A9X3Z801_9PROT|nr:nucleotide exchange factor GrpE [Govania unica]MDA5194656.1 nucleotide exchange factor GrpE [Govania unica]